MSETCVAEPFRVEAEAGSGAVLIERRMKSLDGWRGVAILAVLFYHYGNTTHELGVPIRIFNWIAGGGWAGVELFFVLSGFLITGILLDTRGHRSYFRNFYVRRTLRIFPLYYAVLLGILALTPLLHLQWKPGHWWFFLYLGNIAMRIDPSLVMVRPWFSVDHLWSLAVEEQFYLVWPLVVLLVPTRRALLRFALAGLLAGLLLRGVLLLSMDPSQAIEWSYHTLPMRCDGLLCGAIGAILVREMSLKRASRSLTWPAWIGAAGAVLVVAHQKNLGFHEPLPEMLLHPFLAILFIKILLLALERGTWAYWIGSLPALRTIGKYSYGFYVFHLLIHSEPLLRVLQGYTNSRAGGGILYALLVSGISFAVAVCSYELFEKRFLKLKSRFEYQAALAQKGPSAIADGPLLRGE